MMQRLIEWLTREEGLRLKAYRDQVGIWTIGIGNTFYKDGRAVKEGDVVTREEAYSLAEFVVNRFAFEVKKALTTPVNDNQMIALVSLCYNIGPGAFAKSTVVKMINAHEPAGAIAEQWRRSFRTAKGKELPVLVARRAREAALFIKPIA